MRRKILKILTILIFGAYLINSFYYIDTTNGCYIRVVPNIMPSNWNTKEVITLLKTTSKQDYDYLCKNITSINKNQNCGGMDGGCFYSDQKETIYIGNDLQNIALTSAIVVHELCHARQGNENRPFDEKECYTLGWEYLKKNLVY